MSSYSMRLFLDLLLSIKTRKMVVFHGEARAARAMFRVSKTAKIKKKGMFLDWLAQSLYKQVYYRDWHHSIGSVLKILFFY